MNNFFVNNTFPGYYFYIFKNCSLADFAHLQTTWFWALVCITNTLNYAFIVMGIILNVMSFKILNKHAHDSITRIILRHVAVFDIFVLVINGIDVVIHTLEDTTNMTMDFRYFISYFHGFLWIPQSSFITIRNWSMTYLAVRRCSIAVSPESAARILNKKTSTAFVTLLWMIVLPVNIPKFLEINLKIYICPEVTYMAAGGSGYTPLWYTWITSLVFNSMVPLVLCVIANIILFVYLRRAAKYRDQTTGRKGGHGTKMIIILSAMFVICQIPMILYGCIVMYPVSNWVFNYSNLIGTLINDIDSSCNFFIYMKTSPRFRKAWFERYPCMKCCSKSGAGDRYDLANPTITYASKSDFQMEQETFTRV